jgi:hypothetical protein
MVWGGVKAAWDIGFEAALKYCTKPHECSGSAAHFLVREVFFSSRPRLLSFTPNSNKELHRWSET